MTKSRIAVLLLGPIPIVALSLALTYWWRPGGVAPVSVNQVLSAAETATQTDTRAGLRVEAIAAELSNRLASDCAARAADLRARLGAECSVIARTPFVVAGDMTEPRLVEWCERTIEPATRMLTRAYFRKGPTLPITVLLFTGEASYDRYARELFGDEGISVYGYYKPQSRTLVMNISTGGGTLVHELTHALIDFDFPEVPDWFNEGLASLYEQCRFLPDDAGLEGLPNWRLPHLQQAVRQGRLRSLEQLMLSDDFRGADVGINYAQARYFCLFLQERKLLEEFYRRFRAAQAHDPRGVQTVRELFADRPWSKLDDEFQAWTLTLVKP